MSGGSYDYVYRKINYAAEELRRVNECTYRRAFQELLFLVAEAMYDIEWVDSCDYGKGDEIDAIKKCFSYLKASPEIVEKALAYDRLIEQLEELVGAK